jgi:hypothetical protein
MVWNGRIRVFSLSPQQLEVNTPKKPTVVSFKVHVFAVNKAARRFQKWEFIELSYNFRQKEAWNERESYRGGARQQQEEFTNFGPARSWPGRRTRPWIKLLLG